MREPGSEPSDLIRSVSRALRIVEAVGRSRGGLTVKQIARRCELTLPTTYHLVRTLTYEGYLVRRGDGSYVVGLEVADRFRELAQAFSGPPTLQEGLRRTAVETGYSHYLGRFVGGHVAITTVAEGAKSPHVEDLIPGFDDAAHATALGKALLSTLTTQERRNYLRTSGLRSYTRHTITDTDALEFDLAVLGRRGVFVEEGQYRDDLACAAVLVSSNPDPERRLVVATCLPREDFASTSAVIRARLRVAAHSVSIALGGSDT